MDSEKGDFDMADTSFLKCAGDFIPSDNNPVESAYLEPLQRNPEVKKALQTLHCIFLKNVARD